MSIVQIGVIGCGKRMFELVQRICELEPRIRVAAIVEPSAANLARAKEAFGRGLQVYRDATELAADGRLAWVFVGSINSLHREHAVACLDAGKDVFCEKPLATTVEDCLAIRGAVERSGRQFSLGLTMRYGKMNRLIKQMIDQGKIGVPISLEMNETLGFNHGGMIHSNWRRFREMAGTHLLEKCCHDIDCTDWFLGSLVRRVASFGGCNFFTPRFQGQVDRIGPGPAGEMPFRADPRSETDPFTARKDIVDNQVVIIEYENAVRATFHLNCSTSIPERRFYLCGSEGTIRGDRHSGRLEFQPVGWSEPMEVYPNTRTEGGHGGSDEVLCREVIDSILHGTSPKAGVVEGIRSAVTCFAIDEAMERGEVVQMQPHWERVGLLSPSAGAA